MTTDESSAQRGGGPFAPGRPRLVEATLTRHPARGSIVRVTIEREGRTGKGVDEALGGETVMLRCAATAALEALSDLLGEPGSFSLVGVKRIPAFDQTVVLVCVGGGSGHSRKLLGCVPVMKHDVVYAVAEAVLHATNRLVEAVPNSDGDGDESDAGDQDDEGDAGDQDDEGDASDPAATSS